MLSLSRTYSCYSDLRGPCQVYVRIRFVLSETSYGLISKNLDRRVILVDPSKLFYGLEYEVRSGQLSVMNSHPNL